MNSTRWVFAALGMLIVMGSPAHAQTIGGSCGCGDVADLLNRINMAHAAIDKYRAEIPAVRTAIAGGTTVNIDTRAPGSTKTDYDLLQESIARAQADVGDPAARTATAKTHFFSCGTDYTFPAGASCLLGLLDHHEQVHRNRCEKDWKSTTVIDAIAKGPPAVPLLSRIDEEIDAYTAEIAEAVRRLRALPASCRPKGWVGVITAQETKRLHTEQTRQATAKTPSSKEQVRDELRRWGVIRYGPNPTASWNSQKVYSADRVTTGMIGCVGGLRPRPPDREATTASHEDANGSGASLALPTVNFNIAFPYYTLDFDVPEIIGKLRMDAWNDYSGQCRPEQNGRVPNPSAQGTGTWRLDRSGLQVSGRVNPSDSAIDGSDVQDLAGPLAIPGVPLSEHKVEVQWHLHNID